MKQIEETTESRDVSNEQLQQEKDLLNSLLSEIFKKRDALNENILALRKKIDAISEEQATRMIAVNATLQPTQWDWDWLLYEDGLSHRDAARKDALDKLGLNTSGYYPDICQSALKLKMKKDDMAQAEQVTNGLQIVLPFIKEIKQQDKSYPFKRLAIFEESLSEHGIWALLIFQDKAVITKTIYGREHDHKSFDNLLEAIQYIAKNLPAPSYSWA